MESIDLTNVLYLALTMSHFDVLAFPLLYINTYLDIGCLTYDV
jgi:hypothetical protein